MNVVVNFKMRNVWENPTTNLALVKLLLARLDSAVCRIYLYTLVYVLTITLLVHNIVPVSLKPFTAYLSSEFVNFGIKIQT